MGYFSDIDDELIKQTGAQAEQYMHTDPNASMIKQGMILEYVCAKFLKAIDPVASKEANGNFDKLIKILSKKGWLNKNTGGAALCNKVRKNRNDAAHKFFNDEKAASLTIQPLSIVVKKLLEAFELWKRLTPQHSESNVPKKKSRQQKTTPSNKTVNPEKQTKTKPKKEQDDIPILKIAYQVNEVVYTPPTPENELKELFTSIMDNFEF